MPIVRQVPRLYLRGSLANVTMKNLSQEEKEHAAKMAEYVANHPQMARHRTGFCHELSRTIGADYSDDRHHAADEEYQTAVWKATVELLYHRSYTFVCEACGSDTAPTQTGRQRKIDQQKIPCPNCRKVFIVDPGDTNLQQGTYVTHEEFQQSYITFTPIQRAPKCRSSIKYISGARKYSDEKAQQILSDEKQLAKFFGEFVWNYFRQQINENRRREHKYTETIRDRADLVIMQELLAILQKYRISHHYHPNNNPSQGYYSVSITGLLTPPEFTTELVMLAQKAADNQIDLAYLPNEIHVLENPDARELTTAVTRVKHVLVHEDAIGEDYTIAQLSFRTIGIERVDSENHVEAITNADLLAAVRESLPTGDCRRIFDIHTGTGEDYDKYIEQFGDHTKPRKNHLASFFGIAAKTVKQHTDTIKVQCLAHDLTPK